MMDNDCSEDLMAMVDDCESRESRMSEWECSFIDSIRQQLLSGNRLSAKQLDKLNSIWEQVTERG